MEGSTLPSHRGVLILILGILGLITCPILPPFAWVMGNNDLAAMRAGRMDPSGQGLTEAGRICGIIGTVLVALGLVIGLGFVLFAVVLGAAVGTQ
jgi:hypothetical protein